MMKVSTKIKIEMLKAGVTGAEISRRAGVDRTAIYHVLSKRSRSTRLRTIIAEALGLSNSIWAELDNEKEAT